MAVHTTKPDAELPLTIPAAFVPELGLEPNSPSPVAISLPGPAGAGMRLLRRHPGRGIAGISRIRRRTVTGRRRCCRRRRGRHS